MANKYEQKTNSELKALTIDLANTLKERYEDEEDYCLLYEIVDRLENLEDRRNKLSTLRSLSHDLELRRKEVDLLQEKVWELEQDADVQRELQDEIAEYEMFQDDYVMEEDYE